MTPQISLTCTQLGCREPRHTAIRTAVKKEGGQAFPDSQVVLTPVQ